MEIRSYVWLATGPRRLPKQRNRSRYPQLAATRQLTVWVEYEFREGKLYMTSPKAHYTSFDKDGRPYHSADDIVDALDDNEAFEVPNKKSARRSRGRPRDTKAMPILKPERRHKNR